MIGQHKRNINIVPYQDDWVKLYERESQILRKALGDKVLRLEHIGSTSIHGMAAKPVIDIMIAVESMKKATELIPEVESLGYLYRSNDIIPERRFFVRESSPEVRTHHLNLTIQDSSFWVNQLAFRDYLRTHDTVAAEYVDLKMRLAETYAQTQQLDLDGKTDFVARVLELVKVEGGKTS